MRSILFLVPKMVGPREDGHYNTAWSDSIHKFIQQGRWKIITPAVLVLAQIAQEEGYEVTIIDEEYRSVDWEQQYDIVCIYTVTPNAKRAYDYASIYRNRKAWVALGGVHSYFQRSEARLNCDTLMIGEGEYIMRQFLRDYKAGKPKAEYTQETGKVNLEDSPIPLYDYLNPEEQRLLPIQTARGCSHSCNFCNVKGLYGKTFRSKSVRQLEAEFAAIDKLTTRKNIYVTDDNIFSTNEHFLNLCHLFQKHRYTWYANTDISFANDEEKVKLAYKSGLRQVLIGLESVDPSNLYGLDKDNFKYNYLKKYKEYIDLIQSNGIGVVGSFIIGQLHDTKDTFRYLEEFIYETKLYGANITVSTPYPGTPLYFSMKKEERITTFDWNYYTIFQPIIKIDNMTIDELNDEYVKLLNSISSEQFIQNKQQYFKRRIRDNLYET